MQGVVVSEDGMIDDETAPATDDDGKPEKLAGKLHELDAHTPVPVPIGPIELPDPQTPVELPDGYGYGGALMPLLTETTPIELETGETSEDEMPADDDPYPGIPRLLETGATRDEDTPSELEDHPPVGYQPPVPVPVGNAPALEERGMVIVLVSVDVSVVVDSKVVVKVALLETYVFVTVHGFSVVIGILVTIVV